MSVDSVYWKGVLSKLERDESDLYYQLSECERKIEEYQYAVAGKKGLQENLNIVQKEIEKVREILEEPFEKEVQNK